jgi:hypothetical protein
MSDMDSFFSRANEILDRLQKLLPDNTGLSMHGDDAKCWYFSHDKNSLLPVYHLSKITLIDLKCIDRQKDTLSTNTRQFVSGLPANNALLWGPRGTGKSSLIKALLNEYHRDGLRLIEIRRNDMDKLPEICDLLYEKKGRYILFCDDLSFEENDPGYKAIKVILDGSVKQTPDNVLVYATSNRRHLVPEHMADNLDAGIVDGELHYGDAIEEKLSLSERFGLWIAFHPFNQEDYLRIVNHWMGKFLDTDMTGNQEVHRAALQWALQHGSRSGRSAMLFCRDWAGKKGLKNL